MRQAMTEIDYWSDGYTKGVDGHPRIEPAGLSSEECVDWIAGWIKGVEDEAKVKASRGES